MSGSAFVSRLVRLSLIDGDGAAIGRVDDLVVVPSRPGEPPAVLGFVAAVDRRRIFVNASKISEIHLSGVRMVKGTVELRRFQARDGELAVRADLLGKRIGGEVVNDISITATPLSPHAWEVADVALASSGILRRRRVGRIVTWRDLPTLWDTGRHIDRQVAELRDMHGSDMAEKLTRMPLEQRRRVVEAMEDNEVADLLEELPEDEQVRLIQRLEPERVADIIEEMEADDAADLLAELSYKDREDVLEAMEDDGEAEMRRLMAYEPGSAGGLMTPDPLILTPDVTVGEALARLREHDVAQVLAANVFVTEAPTETPTGRYLGMVGFQRLLRVPPGQVIGEALDSEAPEPVAPDLSDDEVARRLATYDGLALPVVDRAGRLLGAVTVDDVLDRVLPVGWRRR